MHSTDSWKLLLVVTTQRTLTSAVFITDCCLPLKKYQRERQVLQPDTMLPLYNIDMLQEYVLKPVKHQLLYILYSMTLYNYIMSV